MYSEIQPSPSPDIALDPDLDFDIEHPQSTGIANGLGTTSTNTITNTRPTSAWEPSPIRKRARYYSSSSDSDQEVESDEYGSLSGTTMSTPLTAEAGGRIEDQERSSFVSVSSGSSGIGPTGRRQSRSCPVAGKSKSVGAGMGELIMKTATLGETKKRPKRDDDYYMEDGSCVLLVDDTLFNVHRTILSRDGSSFSTMFTLPQGNHQKEGMSDENPIVLTGDTVLEFKNFLWSLYALPHELNIVHTPVTPLPRLIDIARIANKYSFKSLETWSLDAIQVYVNRKPSPILTAISPGTGHDFSHTNSTVPSTNPTTIPAHPSTVALLTRLVRLAQMCSHDRLLTTMIALLRQLMSQSIQYAYLAMVLADELNLRSLRGAAYPEVMQKAVVVRRAERCGVDRGGEGDRDGEKEGEIDKKGRLVVTRAQQLRLLSGYYRLTSTWEHLRSCPPSFDHAPSCGATWHQHGCTQSWLEFWKEKTRSDSVLGLGLTDVLGRLRAVGKEYEKWGSASYMHHDCRMAVRRAIQEKIRAVEEELPSFFEEGD